AMELLAPRRHESRARHVLGQGVLEDADGLAGLGPLVEELEPGELGQMRTEADAGRPDLKAPARELPPESRSRLHEPLGNLGQPVDARGEHTVNRVGHLEPAAAGPAVADDAREVLE